MTGTERKTGSYVTIITAVLILAAVFVPHIRRNSGSVYPMTADTFYLDTFCSVTLYEGGGKEALDAAVDELRHCDGLFDFANEDSDIYRINHRDTADVRISEETTELLAAGKELCVLSEGALEPAIRPVTELWNFKDTPSLPDAEMLDEALGRVKSLAYSVENGVFHSYDPELSIDVGAIAKGYIADRVAERLREYGTSSAIINLGGNVFCLGARPGGQSFTVGIRDPFKDGSTEVKKLSVRDASVVTAGAYERCFILNGVRYHHIIDPSTGWPCENGLESVSVEGPLSLYCDGLSTALFVMGYEKGSEFLKSFNAYKGSSYRAYFLYSDGELREV